MNKLFRLPLLALTACAVLVSGCATTTTPIAPPQVQVIGRQALDFAFHSFDAGLYAFDFAMDLGKPKPGSDQAKAIAAAGRKVLQFLNAAEAARQAGNATSYNEAFTQATAALDQFKDLLGIQAPHAMGKAPPLAPIDRAKILARA